jgi:hypothetical protein
MGALMKSRKGSLVLVCLLVVLLLLPGYADSADSAAEFAGGSGTEDDPFLIATAQQLARVSSCLDAHFRLMADIDLNVAPYNRGKGWKPIGSMDEPFTGSFDGNGRTIRGLYINREDEDYIGLFGLTVEGSALRNIRLEEVKIRGRNYVGGLGGLIYDGSIDDCYVSGTVRGEKDTGGLVGDNYGEVVASSAAGAVTGTHSVGGLLGYHGGRAADCYALGDVKGDLYTGGLAGIVDEQGTLSNSYAAGPVTGNHMAGGFVGANMGRVATCYATGDVTCEKGAGGFVGYNYLGEITPSYAAGAVTGSDMIGGFVGLNEGAITASYAAGAVRGDGYVGGFAGEKIPDSCSRQLIDTETKF